MAAVDIDTIGVRLETEGLVEGQKALDAVTASANKTADAADQVTQKATGVNAQMVNMKAAMDAATRAANEQAATTRALTANTNELTLGQLALIDRANAMAAALGKTRSEMVAMQADEMGIRTQLQPVIDQLAAAEKAQHGFSLATAGATRELGIMGGEIMRGNWTRLEGSLIVLANRTGALQIAIQALTSPLGIVIAGLAALSAVAVTLAMHEEHITQNTNLMLAQLEASGRVGTLTADQMKGLVSQLVLLPGVSRDAADAMLESFAKTRQIGTEMFGDLSKVSVDYAFVTGEKLPEAAKKLAGMFADPVKGAEELQKQFGFLTTEQELTIKSMVEMGDTAGAQKLLLEELNAAILGLKDKSMTPLQHAVEDLKVSWTHLNDNFSTGSGGLQLINKFLTNSVDLMSWIIDHSHNVGEALKIQIPGVGMQSLGMQGFNYLAGVIDPNGHGSQTTGGRGSINNTSGATNDERQTLIDTTDALMKKYEAMAKVADKDKEYEAAVNELDVAIQNNTQVYGANSLTVKKLVAELDGLIENHNKHLPKVRAVKNEYESLMAVLMRNDHEADVQLATGEKMTSGQKYLADETLRLNKAFADGHLTAAEWGLAIMQVTQTAAKKDAIDALAQSTKDYNDQLAEQTKNIDTLEKAGDKELKQLDDRIGKLKVQIENTGKTKEQIDLLNQSRLVQSALADEEAAQALRNAAIYAGPYHDAYIQYAKDLDDAAAKKRTLAALEGDLSTTQGQADAAKQAERAWQQTDKAIQNDLYNAILDGGGEGAKKLFRQMEMDAAKMVLKPVVDYVSGGIASMLNPSASSAGGGIGGTISTVNGLNSAYTTSSNYISAFSAGYSGTAAIGTGGSFASTVGGGLATDAMGATVAEGTAAAGIETGVGAGMTAALGSIPVYGWIALAAIAAFAMFSGSGGAPKVGGQASPFTTPEFDVGAHDNSGSSVNLSAAQSLMQTSYDTLVAGFGGTTGQMKLGLGISTDPGGTAASMVQAGAFDSSGKLVVDNSNLNVGRSDSELQAAISSQTTDVIFKALKASNLSKPFQDFFNAVSADATVAQEQAAVKTAQDVAAYTNQVQYLGGAFTQFSTLSVQARADIIAVAGGLQALTQASQTYYDNFTNSATKTKDTYDAINRALSSVGLSINGIDITSANARVQFKALVDSIDQTTAAGGKQYATLMGVAGAFASITPALDATTAATDAATAALQRQDAVANERLGLLRQLWQMEGQTGALRADQLSQLDASNRALQEQIYALQDQQTALQDANSAADAAKSALVSEYNSESSALQQAITQHQQYAQSLRDASNALLINPTTTSLAPGQSTAIALQQYQTDVQKAQAGDMSAVARLQTEGTTYLAALKNSALTKAQYDAGVAMVAGTLQVTAASQSSAATIAQSQLDTMKQQMMALGLINTTAQQGFAALLAAYNAANGKAVALGGGTTTSGGASGGRITSAQFGSSLSPLSADQVASDQSWINTQWGGSFDANGQFQAGSAFKNGVYDASNNQRNNAVLGAAMAQGLSFSQIAQVTGLNATDIAAYAAMHPQLIDSSAAIFQSDAKSGFYGKIPAYASGTDYVPQTGVALVHQGEAIIPASQNSRGGDGVTAAAVAALQNDMRITHVEMIKRLQNMDAWLKKFNDNGLYTKTTP